MVKKSKLVSTALLVCMFLVLFAGVASAAHRLSFTTHDPVTSGQSRMKQTWIDRVNERSGGRLDIALFPGGSLAGPVQALDAVKTGAADIGWLFVLFYPGQFPVLDSISLPLIGLDSSTQGTYALWDMMEYSDDIRKEVAAQGLKILMLYTNPVNFICTATKPVYTLADMQGLRMRAPAGTATDMLALWGSVPIMMGPGDVFQGLERGTLDGYIFEYTGLEAFRLPEVTNHYTEVRFYAGAFVIGMNQQSFDALPPDLQQIIEEESGRAMSLEFSYLFQADDRASRAKIIAEGGNVITISDEVLAEFQVEADNYTQAWVDSNQSADFDAQGYLNKLKEVIKSYEGR